MDFLTSRVHSHRYEERGPKDNWLVGDLYVRRSALPDPPPKTITIAIAY